MYKILPVPKKINVESNTLTEFNSMAISFHNCSQEEINKLKKIIKLKMKDFDKLKLNYSSGYGEKNTIVINIYNKLDRSNVKEEYQDLFIKQGYLLESKGNTLKLYFDHSAGVLYAFSSIKQLIRKNHKGRFTLPDFYLLDYPEVEQRALATTFAWYAGYGRVGFDMQLWDFEDWKAFLDYCSDFKINQLNMCMYGYWPFKYDEYPETTLKDFKMKIWNEESENWIEIKYTHPNIVKEFLPDLINHAHDLCINIYAYIGLNSYNGGYSNIYKDKRMKIPKNSKFINDFDTLCINNEDTIKYLKTSLKKITGIGFDGIIFEESEESFWFCNCKKCKAEYLDKTESPAEAKHMASYKLLNILYNEIKEENPKCKVGLRAWREPPLKKDIGYLKKCEASIPKDVSLYWSPGLYVSDDEFKKWVEVFGKDRICARDTEANAISSCLGRLFRMFRSNIIRSEEETNHQHIDNDIRQHKGSARLGVRGINGYMFEFYSYFLHFFVHANYGWDSNMEEKDFYGYAIESVFGKKLKNDVLYILKNILTIHESQISIFTSEFPFQRNKVEKRDIKKIEKAKKEWKNILNKIQEVKSTIEDDEKLNIYYKHFNKIENAHRRNLYIYELCLNSIKYDDAKTETEKIKYLEEIYYYNEKDFDYAKKMFFDINPVNATGIKASMYPYHEIKRVINNMLNPENKDDDQIYLGVEALGWLWL